MILMLFERATKRSCKVLECHRQLRLANTCAADTKSQSSATCRLFCSFLFHVSSSTTPVCFFHRNHTFISILTSLSYVVIIVVVVIVIIIVVSLPPALQMSLSSALVPPNFVLLDCRCHTYLSILRFFSLCSLQHATNLRLLIS